MTTRAKQRESISNHAKAPICAAFVGNMRKHFGEDQITVLYVREGSFELGRPYDSEAEGRAYKAEEEVPD